MPRTQETPVKTVKSHTAGLISQKLDYSLFTGTKVSETTVMGATVSCVVKHKLMRRVLWCVFLREEPAGRISVRRN